MKKQPIYEPFDRSGGGVGVIGLEFFEPDCRCFSEEDFGESEESLDEMELDELEVLASDLEDGIDNWDTIVDIELNSCRRKQESSEDLTNARRHKKQLEVELRKVKKRIKMMKKQIKEATVA